MALESVRLRRSRNANGISEERREEFRNLVRPPIFGPHVGTASASLEAAPPSKRSVFRNVSSARTAPAE